MRTTSSHNAMTGQHKLSRLWIGNIVFNCRMGDWL